MRVSTEITPGPLVAIHCPACGTRDIFSASWEKIEIASLVIRHRTNWVQCGACGKVLLSKLPIEQIERMTPEQLESVVVLRYPPYATLFGILAVLLGWTPWLGQIICAFSFWFNWGRPGWMRATWIVFLLGLLVLLGWALAVTHTR